MKESSLEIKMKQVPIMIGRALRNQTETITSRGRTVRLLIPGKLVLEPSFCMLTASAQWGGSGSSYILNLNTSPHLAIPVHHTSYILQTVIW